MKALENKLSRDKAAILNGAEVAALARQVRRLIDPLIADSAAAASVQVEDGVRWAAVRTRCQQARAERGLGIRHVSVALGLPQYRLKAIEAGALSELRPDMARRYFRFLAGKFCVLPREVSFVPWEVACDPAVGGTER
jgi:hypothetical protein